MAFVRYQSPDDTAFLVFDASRFRVDHAVYLLEVEALRSRIASTIEERRDWNLEAMKLLEENRRLASCLEWLESLGDDPDLVAIPDLKHEPALDVVADRLIAALEFEKAFCTACELEFRAEQFALEPWSFEEDGVTVRGVRSSCPMGHTVHVLTEGIDAPGLEGLDE